MRLLYNGGLRVSELVTLRWRNLVDGGGERDRQRRQDPRRAALPRDLGRATGAADRGDVRRGLRVPDERATRGSASSGRRGVRESTTCRSRRTFYSTPMARMRCAAAPTSRPCATRSTMSRSQPRVGIYMRDPINRAAITWRFMFLGSFEVDCDRKPCTITRALPFTCRDQRTTAKRRIHRMI